MTAIGGSPFAVVGPGEPTSGPIALSFAPDGNRMVAGFLFDGTAQGFGVSAGGVPTLAGSALLGPTVEGLAVAPDGQRAYAGTRTFGGASAEGVKILSLSPDGSLIATGTSVDSDDASDLAITPDGRYLFVWQGGNIARYAINADGSLAELAPPVMLPGIRYFTVSPDGRFLFALQQGPGAISSFAIGADGGLAPIGESLLTGASNPDLFSANPSGSRLYVPEPGSEQILTVAVAADGQLALAGSLPDPSPRATAVSPDGRFLYWLTTGDAEGLRVAAIGADGIPVPLPFPAAPLDIGEATRIVFQPGPAPVAAFKANAAAPGAATTFNGGSSANAAHYNWSFGDGTTLADGGPKPSHVYAAPGKYTVTLSVSDAQGCGAQQIYTGQSTTCPGGTATTASAVVDSLPVLSKLKAQPKKFRPKGVGARTKGKTGTTFRYVLNEKATVRLKIDRKLPGRLVGRKCKKPTQANKGKKKCVRFVKVGPVKGTGKVGLNKVQFNGKRKGKPLPPGAYRLTAVATDSAQGRSAPTTAAFRVLPY